MTVLFNTHRVGRRGRHARDYVAGAGSVFNIHGSGDREYNFAETPDEADSQAIANDWLAIGEDLEKAITQYHRSGGRV